MLLASPFYQFVFDRSCISWWFTLHFNTLLTHSELNVKAQSGCAKAPALMKKHLKQRKTFSLNDRAEWKWLSIGDRSIPQRPLTPPTSPNMYLFLRTMNHKYGFVCLSLSLSLLFALSISPSLYFFLCVCACVCVSVAPSVAGLQLHIK